jgi:hypothetical protein
MLRHKTARLPAVLVALLACLPAPRSQAYPMEILVPAYFYPTLGSEWHRLIGSAPRVPIIAILNPASGPGTFQDPNYVAVVDSLRLAGGKVFGYVDTDYARRDPQLVRAEVDLYPTFYAIDGVFLDQMANDTLSAHYAYYEALYNSIKGAHPAYRIVGNPGTWTQEPYISIPTVDGVCSYENSTGYEGYASDPWVFSYGPERFAHISYAVASESTMRSYLALAAARNAGMVFITDDILPNPYDTLPAYWDQEVAAVESFRVAGVETAGNEPWRLDLSVAPNPVDGRCEIRWATPNGTAPSIWIADASGRVVKHWNGSGAWTGGRLTWNCLDDRGQRVPSGVYYVLARAGEAQGTGRLLIIP